MKRATGAAVMTTRPWTVLLAALALGAGAASSPGIEFQFDYQYDFSGLFDDPTARTALETAAHTFDVLLDDLLPITPSGLNTWRAQISHPNPNTPTSIFIDNLSIPANTLKVFINSADLPGQTLGLGGPGGYQASGISQAWLDTVASRGEGTAADEFGPWGGSITFDTHQSDGQERNWHFDVTSDPARNTSDLYSVAVHELGHLLGFGSAASFHSHVSGGFFHGPQVTAMNGGSPVRLEQDPADPGRFPHWAPETRSPPGDDNAPIAAMDPTIVSVNGLAERRHFTALDFAVLDDLGWTVDPSVYEVAPDPIAGDYNNNGAVEQADLNLVLLNWGQSAASVPDDWSNDLPSGIVDQDELNGVLLHWGNSAASTSSAAFASAAIPEPATCLLCLLTGVAAIGLSRVRASIGPRRTTCRSSH